MRAVAAASARSAAAQVVAARNAVAGNAENSIADLRSAGGRRFEAQDNGRRGDEGERRRYDERPGYDDRASPRPNYMSPAPGVSARRGYAPPESYRGGVVDDYRRYRLRPPPQGYDWVRMGNGFGLVERRSGRIYDRVN